MLEQSCTFVNAYYGILDYEWLKPQYIGGTHKNTGCPIKKRNAYNNNPDVWERTNKSGNSF